MSRKARQRVADIYREHFDELRRFIARRLPGGEPADLAQEVFVRLLCLEEGYQIEQPRSFLFRIAANLTLDHMRTLRSRTPHRPLEECDEPESGCAGPEAIVSARQRLALLLRAVDELPPRCREVFLLHKFDHHSHEQIAERLGISINMVEKHVIKALAHCRRRLSELE